MNTKEKTTAELAQQIRESSRIKQEFIKLVLTLDAVQCNAVILYLNEIERGETLERAKEVAADYLDKHPGYEALANRFRGLEVKE